MTGCHDENILKNIMLPVHRQILKQLDIIEQQLVDLELLSQQPSEAALNSNMPFACDQMDFHDWLQWVLIPRTRHSIEKNISAGMSSNIAAMAEIELSRISKNTDRLLLAIQQLDELFNQI